ncbi:Chaperone protein DnaJ [Diplonema papillatum]|nr:Chaperone protein DnaJ [Diplonema papillatum]
MSNLFEVLGVSVSSDERAIKKAYKELALKHHPDKGGDQEMFKKVNEAYDILMDEEQREKYITLVQANTHSSVLDQFVRQQEEFAKENNLARPSSKYERTCRNWMKGRCTQKACLYRHYRTADTDKKRSNKVCHDFIKGYCRFGGECIFRHPGGLDQDDQSNWEVYWTCSDVWRNCKTQNHILENPLKCKECGAKRKLARCKFPNGTTAQITVSHQQIMEEIIKRQLFFSRDGIYRKQMHKLIQKMQSLALLGQMVPVVQGFYPSANCYHCVLQDGSFLIVPEKFLKRGVEKWTCTQCKYQNQTSWGRCGLCDARNPFPVEDWSPFCGTWKSQTGNYYLKVEDHNVSSSEPSHYYTNLKVFDSVLTYNVTLVDDDNDDDYADSSGEEDDGPEELGTVRLVLDGKNKMKGELRLVEGGSQKTLFQRVDSTVNLSDDEVSSSSFDSAESTPTRERRLTAKREGKSYRRGSSGSSDGRRKSKRDKSRKDDRKSDRTDRDKDDRRREPSRKDDGRDRRGDRDRRERERREERDRRDSYRRSDKDRRDRRRR